MKLFIRILFLLLASNVYAQYKIEGKVEDKDGRVIEFANVGIENTTWGTTTDTNGDFSLEISEAGTYQLIISVVGYVKNTQLITVNSSQKEIDLGTIGLESSEQLLEAIEVSDNSVASEMETEAVTINTIDARTLQAQTQDVARLLDKVQGVKIRQSGGLGSETNITLNGLTGNAVRFYYNGIPVEFLGQGFSLNTISVSNVERVEVYKGVMPIEIGTDALGGGINVVTGRNPHDEFDISYQYGSFNTHRVATNFTKTFAQNWYFNVNANYNYSDNDYEMNVRNNTYGTIEGNDLVLGTENIRVRRFHDSFYSFLGQANVGYYNPDNGLEMRFQINGTLGRNELQHGVRVGLVPFGEASFKQEGLNINMDIQKSFGDNWELRYFGLVGYSRILTDDSTSNIYDWQGNNVSAQFTGINNGSGAEFLALPSQSDIYNYNTVHRLTVKRKFDHNFQLTFSHLLAYQDRNGNDPLSPKVGVSDVDPNSVGFQLMKNIGGLELKKSLMDEKVETLAAVKYYQYSGKGINIFLIDSGEIIPTLSEDNFWGYNFAAKWNITENIFIRTSFEEAVRIPTQAELFGDLRTIGPNFDLKPEKSQNLNLGLNVAFQKYLQLDVNYFLRNQTDLIYLEVNDISLGFFRNRDKARGTGVEVELKGEPFKNFNYVLNGTYQQIKINGFTDIRDQFLDGKPIPNIPTLFGNLSLSYVLENFIGEENNLRLAADANFIDEFSFIQEGGVRNDDNFIPVQNSYDFGITYSLKNKLSFNFQVYNAFDAELFDFISVPRPGRNYAFKVRYSY